MSDSKATILYVEDNPDNRLLISRVLMIEGYKILFAENAQQTMSIAQSEVPIDLVLMDINLPDVDGYTLTHMMREIDRFKEIPILALTANVMKGDREKSLEAGCDGYIQKPIDIDALPMQVQSFLDRAAKDNGYDR
jgi:two-component system cell cycle response regulator DivK